MDRGWTGARARHHDQGKAVRMLYTPPGRFAPISSNLIDTPGHVDFTYEVSRALAPAKGLASGGWTQGVEAQTLANATLARDAGLESFPLINKVDLPAPIPKAARRRSGMCWGSHGGGFWPARRWAKASRRFCRRSSM